jgi:hypothetical protein
MAFLLELGDNFAFPGRQCRLDTPANLGKVVCWFFILLIPQSYQVGFQLALPQFFEVETNI